MVSYAKKNSFGDVIMQYSFHYSSIPAKFTDIIQGDSTSIEESRAHFTNMV